MPPPLDPPVAPADTAPRRGSPVRRGMDCLSSCQVLITRFAGSPPWHVSMIEMTSDVSGRVSTEAYASIGRWLLRRFFLGIFLEFSKRNTRKKRRNQKRFQIILHHQKYTDSKYVITFENQCNSEEFCDTKFKRLSFYL